MVIVYYYLKSSYLCATICVFSILAVGTCFSNKNMVLFIIYSNLYWTTDAVKIPHLIDIMEFRHIFRNETSKKNHKQHEGCQWQTS